MSKKKSKKKTARKAWSKRTSPYLVMLCDEKLKRAIDRRVLHLKKRNSKASISGFVQGLVRSALKKGAQ